MLNSNSGGYRYIAVTFIKILDVAYVLPAILSKPILVFPPAQNQTISSHFSTVSLPTSSFFFYSQDLRLHVKL